MDISCHGSNDGMAWVNNISGGTSPYAVQWSNGVSGQDTISGLSAGSYTVSVTDDSGCVMMDTVTIDEPDSLVVTFIDSSNVSCNGGSDGWAQFDITGGTTPYVVQSNATANDSVLTNLSAGSHTVKILDDNGCVDSATITLTEPPALISNIDTIIDVKCFGDSTGSVTASSSGGTPPYSYEWDDPANQSGATASSLPAGNYTVTITDDSGCITTDSATIVQPDSFKVDFTVLEPVSCYGASDAMVLASIGGDTTTHSFSWSTGTGAIGTGLDAGTHEVTVTTDSSGCQQTANVTLSQPDSVSLTTTSNPVNCNGGSDGSVSASASGGNGPPFIYVWNTGDSASSVNGLSAGTYEVTAIDTNGCNATSSISISEPAPLDLSTTATPLSCAGGSDGSASVTVSGGTSPYNYAWNDPSGQTSSTADGLTAGTYQVTVTDANNCVDSASVTVTQPEGISFKETDIVDESCPGAKDGAIFLEAEGGTPPYTYILEDDKESSEGAFNGLEGGRDYELTINDGNACNLDTNIRVERPEELVIDFEKDRITTELGQGKRLKPIIRPEDSDGAYNYIWEPNNGLNCVDCREPLATPYNETVYELTVFDENQCRYTETITVSVNNPEILYIPNAFTPNDDDKNDQFRIYGKNINRIDLQIFDRWGEKVFETKDVDEGWDGSFPSGNDAPSGVYVYSVLIEYIDGKTIEKQGSVTLIR